MNARIRAGGVFASLWVAMTLAACARAAVAGDGAFAIATTIFWAGVQGVGLWFAWKNDGPAPRKITDIVAGIGLVASAAEFFSAGILQALMSLLLWLQAARNPVIRTRRDVYFALALGLALVAFGATEARSSAFVVVLVGYGFATLVAMAYCHEDAGTEAGNRDLPLKSVALRPLPLGNLFVVTIAAFVSALAWYLLVPRPDPLQFGSVSSRPGESYASKSWEQEADGRRPAQPNRSEPGKGKTGDSPGDDEDKPSLDITTSAHEHDGQPANSIVMYVQADGPLYLRERTFDRFESDRWTRTDEATQKRRTSEWSFHFDAPQGRERKYVVQMVRRSRSTAIPLAVHVKELTVPVSVIAIARDRTVYLPARLEAGFRYGATSVEPDGQARPVSHDTPEPGEEYLQLPENLSPRIRQLARDVSAGSVTPFAKAAAIEAHLRDNYEYSFETVLTSQGVTPLEDFLFVTRRGHCEFFASAMAVMLRTQGIPARVVNGALSHSYNPVTGFYEVRAFDGHAWVEAHIAGLGWTTFEPTAAYPVPARDAPKGRALEELKEYTEKLAQQESLEGIKSAVPTMASVFSALNEGWQALVLNARLFVDSAKAWIAANAVLLLVASIGLGAAIAIGYSQRSRVAWWIARWVVRFSASPAVAIAAMRQVQRISPSKALRRAPAETIDEYAARLRAEFPDAGAELDTLRRAFNATRYGGGAAADDRAAIVAAFEAVGGRLSHT